MIELQNVWKGYGGGQKRRQIVQAASLVLPPRRKIALLGLQGAGKSTLLRLLSRMEAPDRGAIRGTGLMSWPFGFLSNFEKGATIQQNANMVGHLYDVDPKQVVDIAADLSGVRVLKGKLLRNYSMVERRDIALGFHLALQFDWYFVDDNLPLPPIERQQAIDAVIAERFNQAGVIWATRDPGFVEGYCDAGLVLHRGKLRFYDTLEQAADAFLKIGLNEGAKHT